MSITEFDEKAFEEMLREEGRKEGIEEGIKEGREQGRKEGSMESLINLYKEGIITLDVVSSQLNLSNEELTLLIKNTKQERSVTAGHAPAVFCAMRNSERYFWRSDKSAPSDWKKD